MRAKAPESGQSNRDKAYHFIQKQIIDGMVLPGVAISELAVAREVGVSRTPVREAIGHLVAEGLLEQIPNRGAVVVQLTRQDIIELYELREALESFAIRKAADRGLAAADREKLENSVSAIEVLRTELESSGRRRLSGEEMRKFVRTDMAFHTLLLRAAANRRMIKVVGDTRLLIRIFSLRHENHTLEQLAQIRQYHQDILDAVVRGDSGSASQLLGEHIRVSRQERLDAYDNWEMSNMSAAYASPLLPVD